MLSKAFSHLVFSAVISALAIPVYADSTVRIVRLSYLQNDVQIDRGSGKNEKAIVNLPITAGTKLSTGTSGLAEVEFEDESTIRLAPNTALKITQLALRNSGEKVSTAEVLNGVIYVNFGSSQKSEFTLQFGGESIELARSARFRISLEGTQASIAVFKGDIKIVGPVGTQEVKKKETATVDLSSQQTTTLVKSIEPEPYDDWEKKQEQYHSRYFDKSYSDLSMYRYGLADLAYYGNFFSAPGYGILWQPYFSGIGWNPFLDGAWVPYPGSGFTWVSAYPWGWTPFHCGTWVFLPSYGWAWEPGGVWTNWYSQPSVIHPPAGFTLPRPPAAGTTAVVVTRAPRFPLPAPSSGKLLVRSNSAGLGVPRGSIRNLAPISEKVQNRPIAARVFSSAPQVSGPYRGEIQSSTRSSHAAEPVMHSPPPSQPVRSSTGGQPHR